MNKSAIIKLTALLVILAFLGISIGFTSTECKQLTQQAMVIKFEDELRFVSEEEITKLVTQSFQNMEGALTDTLNAEEIELKIQEHPWVKKAEVFKGFSKNDTSIYAGSIQIKITQETPLFRVMNGADGFYLNKEGMKLPLALSETMHVPLVTGIVNDDFLKNEMIAFIQHINQHAFWKALIQQIDIDKQQNLWLVPRVGDHKINFGTVDNMEKKFRNLKAVYQSGFEKDDWHKYKEVKLAYDNQVVCTLK